MAVDSKSLFNGGAIICAILFGTIMAVSVTTNAAGGLAALIPLITGILVLVAIFKPRAGLYGLGALVIWVDEFKRLAVYFGGAYSNTVYQTLAMPFIVLAALNVGFMINLLFGKTKIDWVGIIIYLMGALLGGSVFVAMEGTFPERVQRSANIAGYITLIPIACSYFKSFDEWRSFFAFQVLVALPAGLWAIKQYFYGFDQLEWVYARSGLSTTHYIQMTLFTNPRVFGFFGSASALSCAAIYCAFSWWHGFRHRRRRFLWLMVAVLYTVILVVSTQRSALLYPLIVLIGAFAFRTKIRTISIYATGISLVIIGIMNSTYLLNEGLGAINRAIATDNAWGSRVLDVSTFSDRLIGWERLNRADSYSLIGKGEKSGSYDDGNTYRNHDLTNKVLINYGVLGMLVIIIPSAIFLAILHRIAFVQNSKLMRNDIAFAIALSLPMIFTSFLGGDNFNANPINLQIWTAFVGVLVVRSQLRYEKLGERELIESSRQKPGQIAPSQAHNA